MGTSKLPCILLGGKEKQKSFGGVQSCNKYPLGGRGQQNGKESHAYFKEVGKYAGQKSLVRRFESHKTPASSMEL